MGDKSDTWRMGGIYERGAGYVEEGRDVWRRGGIQLPSMAFWTFPINLYSGSFQRFVSSLITSLVKKAVSHFICDVT